MDVVDQNGQNCHQHRIIVTKRFRLQHLSTTSMSPEHTSDTSTFILIFSFDFDFFGFVFDVFFFRLVELLLFELLNDIDDRRPDFERSADDRRFVLPIAVPLIF